MDRAKLVREMDLIYPTVPTQHRSRSQICGHIGLAGGDKGTLLEIKEKLLEIALEHPKIGVGKVMVPSSFMLLKYELEEQKVYRHYFSWPEYVSLCTSLGIFSSVITTILYIYIIFKNVNENKNENENKISYGYVTFAKFFSFLFSHFCSLIFVLSFLFYHFCSLIFIL
jgi:hypothetical protein